MSNTDEYMIPSSTLPSDVTDENLEDPARFDLTCPSSTELTEDGDGNKELKKRSHPTSSIWDHLTDAVQPQRAKSNMGKHCETLVIYHKTSGSVRTNLNNCSLFRKVMNGIEDA